MRDRRPERALGGAVGVDVNPLGISGRSREAVDPLLRHVDPGRGAELGPGKVDDVHAGIESRLRLVSPLLLPG